MDHTPISRESMRGLKAEAIEAARIIHVNQKVDQIYHNTVHNARYGDGATSYALLLHYNDIYTFKNMPEIIQKLQSLFPDCSVEKKKMFQGRDGILKDISEVSEGRGNIMDYIVIDWS